MSKKNSYIGGYVDPSLKDRFVQLADERGLSQTDFLAEILEGSLGDREPLVYYDEDEQEEQQLLDQAEWERLGPMLRDELNCLVINAADSHDELDPLYIPQVLETLADMLRDHAGKETPYKCEESEDFADVLPYEAATEVTTVVAHAIREFGESHIKKADLFNSASSFLFQRSDVLYVDARRISLLFTREEWTYLDRLLGYVSEEEKLDFRNLKDYIRHKLGEQMRIFGAGFWTPRDKGMIEQGVKFIESAKGE